MIGPNSGPEGKHPSPSVNTHAHVVLFDGWCPLCVGTTRFLVEKDRDRRFRFASLDSAAAGDLLDRCASEPKALAEVRSGSTVALVVEGRLHIRSDAALQIAARLPFPWRAFSALRIVPRALRDRAYLFVARRRHRVWGRLDSCYVPESKDRNRFL
jgi:predicted DCC family thiol-disulfide oxidoreductase YuxK